MYIKKGSLENGHAMSHHLRVNVRQEIGSQPLLLEETARKENPHVPDFANTEVLASERRKYVRKQKEAFFLAANPREVLEENTAWKTSAHWLNSMKFFKV